MSTPRATIALVFALVMTLPVIAPALALPPLGTESFDPAFEATEWGFIRKDAQLPDAPRGAIFMMDGYYGASSPDDILESAYPVPYPASPDAYFRTRDGTLIALNIKTDFPLVPDRYVLVWASIRGTGCSGGAFDLFDRTHAWDGHEIIEWLAAQKWTTNKVGLYGASYSGITALHIASTDPPHMAAVSANMIIGDMYRDIAYPGGVPNIQFPGVWTVAYRPALDHIGMTGGVLAQDSICATNVATRDPNYPFDHAGFGMYTRRTDDAAYAVRSPETFAHLITKPILTSNAFQDEQTGPRAPLTIWNALHPDRIPVCKPNPTGWPECRVVEPKRLIMSNGVHNTALANSLPATIEWFDHFVLGKQNNVLFKPRVEVLFEVETDGLNVTAVNGVKHGHDFPLPDTTWTRLHLRDDGSLTGAKPAPDEGTSSYAAGSQRMGWDFNAPEAAGPPFTTTPGPDVLVYRTAPLAHGHTVVGPIAVTLTADTTATDTDFFAILADVDPDAGTTTFLARGSLRASHRALDESRTLRNADGDVIRAGHPHTSPEAVMPGAVETYQFEVYPVGHHFRAGHQLELRITTPPVLDGRWGYGPVGGPALNSVHHALGEGSSILVPFVPLPASAIGPDPGCGVPVGYRCVAS